jgi:hypothetical protein
MPKIVGSNGATLSGGAAGAEDSTSGRSNSSPDNAVQGSEAQPSTLVTSAGGSSPTAASDSSATSSSAAALRIRAAKSSAAGSMVGLVNIAFVCLLAAGTAAFLVF